MKSVAYAFLVLNDFVSSVSGFLSLDLDLKESTSFFSQELR